ncbi:hypothetical protein ACWY4P_38590 [Streptomyces sp. LZ34]
MADSRETKVTAADIRAHYPFHLVAALHLPGVELVHHVDDETRDLALQLQRRDGSWARAPLTGEHVGTVTHGGAVDLWEQMEAAWLGHRCRRRVPPSFPRMVGGNASLADLTLTPM